MRARNRIGTWLANRRDNVAGAFEFARENPWHVGIAVLVLMLFVTPVVTRAAPSHVRILDAIRMVESGGNDQCRDGDGGRAIGPFQIHEIYWRDAIAADPSLAMVSQFGYQDCRQRDYAVQVVEAYMKRWVPAAWASRDAETIARTHNGGPRGVAKDATLGYWQRVQARLSSGR